MAEYLVTVKDAACLDEFYADMEFRGYTRTIRKPLSRATGYELTDEQRDEVGRDSRVLAVELRYPPNVKLKPLGAINYDPYTIFDDFDKDSTGSSSQSSNRQWGHLHHAGNTAQRRYGDTPGTVNASTWNQGTVNDKVNVFNNGKHVDVVIMDTACGYNHADWISEETGLTRFVQYDWFAEHNADVIGGLDTDGYASPGNNYVYGTSAQAGSANYHGTHCAGTVAGRHFGWAKEANIYSINVLRSGQTQTYLTTELAFDYVRAFHRNKPINPVTGFKNPTIINCSFGAGYDLSETYPSGLSGSNIYGFYYKGEWYDDGVTPYDQAYGGTTPVGMKGTMSAYGITEIRRNFGIYGNEFPYWSASNSADIADAIADGIVIVKAQGNDYSPRSADHYVSGGTINTNDGNMWYNIMYLDNGYGYYYCREANPYAPGIIQVGALTPAVNYNATTTTLPYGSMPVSFSNRGVGTHVWAAGVNIASVYPPGASGGYQDTKPGYTTGVDFFRAISGTSMAAPQVAGVLACYASGRERFNSADAHRYLQETSNKTEMYTDGWAKNYPSTTRKTFAIGVTCDATNMYVTGQDRRKTYTNSIVNSIRVECLDTINLTLPSSSSEYHAWKIVKGSSSGITNTDIHNPAEYQHTIVASEAAPTGQQEYTTPGTYQWTCPAGVTSVSAVCVGAGGGNNNQQWSGGGGGGALAWKNNISVTPGQQYTVEVGDQWPRASGNYPGGSSWFVSSTVVSAGGGWPDNNIWSPYNAPGGIVEAGDGGGNGGVGGMFDAAATTQSPHITTAYGGGGGAGGYSGNGGNGGSNWNGAVYQVSAGTGGAGGGGYAIQDIGQFAQGAFDTTHGGGGGVGIYGEGNSGAGGTNSAGNRGGKGGSAGANGLECLSYQGNSAPGSYGTGSGGQFGGGSGGGGDAGHGAVRIIWGPNRSFPATNTQNQSAGGSITWTPTVNDTGYYWLVCGSSLQPNHSGQPNEHSNQSEILIIVDPPACYDDSMASGGSSKSMLQVKNTRPDTGLMTEWCHKKGNRFGLGHAALQQEHRDNIKDRSIIGTGENFWPRQNTLNRGVPTGGSNGYQPQGDSIYTTPGTYTWICPANVTSVSVVCIGGGGGGDNGYGHSSGGGASLGWKNDITVVPGNSYTLRVGQGGASGSQDYSGRYGSDGESSYFLNTSTVMGGAGANGEGNQGYVGDGGGNGGAGQHNSQTDNGWGGGGCGGYNGAGGSTNAPSTQPASGSGGAGGGMSGSSDTIGAGAGGGVGIYGIGADGVNATTTGYGGTGGSGGNDGNNGSGVASGGQGGSYGGGGAMGAKDYLGSWFGRGGGAGGNGAVRIMWGGGRSFPDNAPELS